MIKFAASGSFIDAQILEILDRFKSHPFWTEKDALAELMARKPRFGPDERESFLENLLISDMRNATGCLLRPNTAFFQVVVGNRFPPQLERVLTGKTSKNAALPSLPCGASFEPFNGRLVTLWE